MKQVQAIPLNTDTTQETGLSNVHDAFWQFGHDTFHYAASTKGFVTNMNKTSEQPSFISCATQTRLLLMNIKYNVTQRVFNCLNL